jgi:hypothetical protein
MGGWRIPDGILDRTHEFQNSNDQAEYRKAFQNAPGEEQLMAMALICADPSTPESFIMRSLSNPEMPPRTGYPREQPTIQDVLSISSGRARNIQVQGGMH